MIDQLTQWRCPELLYVLWLIPVVAGFWSNGCSKSRSLADLDPDSQDIPAHELRALGYVAAALGLEPEDFDISGDLGIAGSSAWVREGAVRGMRLSEPPLASLEILSAFDRLDRIEISGGPLTSLEGLGSCSELRTLWVRDARVETVAGLENCASLQDLLLRNNRIESLSELATLPELRHLDLSHNRILHPSGLAGRTELESIDLSDNLLENTAGIENLPHLRRLNLARNRLEDLGGLIALPFLEELFVDNNQLRDASTVDQFPNLKLANLSANRLDRFPALVSRLQTHLWGDNPGYTARLASDFEQHRTRMTESFLAPTLPAVGKIAGSWSRGACRWTGRSPRCSARIPHASGSGRIYLARFEPGRLGRDPRRFPPGVVLRLESDGGHARAYLAQQAKVVPSPETGSQEPKVEVGFPYVEAPNTGQAKVMAGNLFADGSGVWFVLEILSETATEVRYEIAPGYVP